MRPAKKNISVIILAGGKAKRLNFPKPYLLFSRRTTFMEKLVNDYYRFGCRKIVLVLNNEFFIDERVTMVAEKYGALFVSNAHSEWGRFYSLKLGIDILTNENYCFIQNIDNPFTTPSLLNKLERSKTTNGYSVPVFKQKGGHPILIGRRVIEGIKKAKKKDFNLRIFLNKYQRKDVSVSNEKVTANINDLNDYRKYFSNQVKSQHEN